MGAVSKRAQGACASWWLWIIGLCCFRAEATSVELKPSSKRSWYHSTRIQRMMEKKGEFSTIVDFEIDSSTDHWSEMNPAVSETEHSQKANRKYFEVLKRRRYVCKRSKLVAMQLKTIEENRSLSMFRDWDGLVVGEKIMEGGQTEIYAATNGDGADLAVKVFKAGSVLEHLEKQWPPALLKSQQLDEDETVMLHADFGDVWGATLLRDEWLLDRFAFVMYRRWGDLRTLIDKEMIESCNKGFPFSSHVVIDLIKRIANDMWALHALDPLILYNDLKAANVLLWGSRTNEGPLIDSDGMYGVYVSDYECLVGVVGTSLWRALEILEQLINKIPAAKVVVTAKCDVYSFAMTCYEIVSGCILFEDYDFLEGHDHVLIGERLELPPNLNPKVENLIRRCWNPNPWERLSFVDILNII